MRYSSGHEDRKGENGLWLRSFQQDGTKCLTRAGLLWLNIEARCNPDGAEQARYPTYAGCVNEFEDFQDFAEWCQRQAGYKMTDEAGNQWHLDKDLHSLTTGETARYGKHCLFMPNKVNQSLKFGPSNTELPIGVTHYKYGRFRAQGRRFDGTKEHLGCFEDSLLAHSEWLTHKANVIYDAIQYVATCKRGAQFVYLQGRLAQLHSKLLGMANNMEEYK